MKQSLSLGLLSLAFALFSGCSGNHGPKVACGPEAAQPVSFETVLQSTGAAGDQSERFLTIRNQDDFQQAWDELFEPNSAPPLPSIDFESEMVIIYAMGTQPSGCYSAEVEGVRGSGPELLVQVREVEPGPSCTCTLALVMPFEVIRLSAHDGPVSLCVRRTELRC